MNIGRGKKRLRMRKRTAAAALSMFMAFTSIPLPAGSVYAEETPVEQEREDSMPETDSDGQIENGETISDGDREEPEKAGSEAEESVDPASVSGNEIPEAVPEENSAEVENRETKADNEAYLADGKGLDLENLSAEYTALDGSKISSTADGRPKLLIFYYNAQYNSKCTIQDITKEIERFSGVDIYAIETSRASKQSVAEFQQEYGCEEITFSYDTGSYNDSSMLSYAGAGGFGGRPDWPVICYIDADNRLQKVTASIRTVQEILSDLETYCAYVDEAGKSYTITYVLSGGENNAANPSVYTTKSDTISLLDAVREGYQFEGWYKDAAYTARVTQIVRGTSGNLTLFAKWKQISETGRIEIDITPAEGNVVVGFQGIYSTEDADKILNRLNEIRWEACQEGVDGLTEADYRPLEWSAELEAITRVRAAEAIVNEEHERPNGESCFTVEAPDHISGNAENIAWNSSGIMAGIEQCYEEKGDFVNQVEGAVTGHYESIICMRYNCVGVGCFRLMDRRWSAVVMQFGRVGDFSTYKDPSQGDWTQSIEIQGSSVTGIAFDENREIYIREGETYKVPLQIMFRTRDYSGGIKRFTQPYLMGGSWQSFDETVAVVDDAGAVHAKGKGTARIGVTVAGHSATVEFAVYGKEETLAQIKRPRLTTYKVGQELDVTGGQVTYLSDTDGNVHTVDMEPDMISGFDSSKPGICRVTVNCGDYPAFFDTLIVGEPVLEASCGRKLSDIPIPSNDYGSYVWVDGSRILDEAGVHTYRAEFIPEDTERFQKLDDIQVKVTASMSLTRDTKIVLENSAFYYNGAEQKPEVTVSVPRSASGEPDIVLVEGQDYSLSYTNNRNAGTAVVTVQGIHYYNSSVSRFFTIRPAPLVIRARDRALLIGEALPEADGYEYEVTGLMAEDQLLTPPAISCNIIDTKEAGQYAIVPSAADAGPNYEITYEKGRLVVVGKAASCMVTYDVQGHGTVPSGQIRVTIGDTLERPKDPLAEGYRFDGWYQDPDCTKAWDFNVDIVQADMTLYAKWLKESKESGFALQEIRDLHYTGKACKPMVCVYDGENLLRAGRDYQIKYYNNIKVNKDYKWKQGTGEGSFFDEQLPYVEVIGKGNYTDSIKVNFNILPASIGDGRKGEAPAAGVTLKVSGQLTTAKKAQKPLSSIRYARAMKQNTDYTLRLTTVKGKDQSGSSLPEGLELENAAVPAGYEGEFLLTIQGVGNYTGSICRTIYVADKTHLIKYARITLGKNLKNIEFTGEAVELVPSEVNSEDTFTVKCGSQFLKYGRDYQVSYRNHDRVGMAELIITGMGGYSGVKSAAFRIRGRALTARTVDVDGIVDQNYTGRPITQDEIALTYAEGAEERELKYGIDYTVSYSKNINKGTATITFKGIEEEGYTGSFRKTFKIRAADIREAEWAAGMQDITEEYSKEGARPEEAVVLTSQAGDTLINGKDYTLRYANNKAVADKEDDRPPTVFVKGRGNYTGEFPVCFNIVRRNLVGSNIKCKIPEMVYKKNKAADYIYKPAVKLMDGESILRAGVDYEITYVNNTQADFEEYLREYLERDQREEDQPGRVGLDGCPEVIITEKEGSNYTLDEELITSFSICCTRLKKSDLVVEIEEAVYTGAQLRPEVTVYYRGVDGNIPLRLYKDYAVSYDSGPSAGKKKGSLTIWGMAPCYGGSVTVKFDIERKKLVF